MDTCLGGVAVRAVILLACCSFALPAAAHGGWIGGDEWQWLILAALLGTGALYFIGVRRLWAAAGKGRGVSARAAASFAGGWAALAAALLSPLDAWSEQLFAAHMVQHELLILVAAPLLVLGRPLAPWSWAVSARARARAGAVVRHRLLAAAWRGVASPLGAWIIHAAALWIWHAPALFVAARVHQDLHALQHASFLASAMLFWWALLRPHAPRGVSGSALVYLFTTMVHTGALGALLVFSRSVWYPLSSVQAPLWGLTPLEDQQLGGLIMWIPGGLVYLGAALLLLARALTRPRSGEAYS